MFQLLKTYTPVFLVGVFMYHIKMVIKAHNYITTVDISTFLFDALLVYSKSMTYLSKQCVRVYNNNEDVKYIVDYIHHILHSMHAFINSYSVEPYSFNWICTSILLVKKQPSFFNWNNTTFLESYQAIDLTGIKDADQFCINKMKEIAESAALIIENDNATESMITMKTDKNYLYFCNKRAPNNVEFNIAILDGDVVKPCLLSIEYTNPVMTSGIVLTLDTKYYYNNNIIFTPIFVRRLLEYQPEIFHFDLNYKLNIMDSNIHQFSLSSSQTLKLTKNGYEILEDAPRPSVQTPSTPYGTCGNTEFSRETSTPYGNYVPLQLIQVSQTITLETVLENNIAESKQDSDNDSGELVE